jgi:ABC-type multidrug transport system fused ATPase/permease subunit
MAVQSKAEFTLDRRYQANRSGPARWIFSHTIHKWPLWIIHLVGAFGNAALAAVGPIIIGRAFNAVLAQPPQVDQLLPLAVALAVSQVVRCILQFGRNFSAELLAPVGQEYDLP